MFGYVFVKKSTLMLAGAACLVAAGLVGYHFYHYHRAGIKAGAEMLADEAKGAVKEGKQKAKKVAEDLAE
ncbi:hypothetical protein LJC04_05915 [Ruminococcaceae bacterium OttesenSCG-928-O06]|nr:hypothetical protein [Ruminococcaceae bacterium OttesenSCG-928-O06]